MAEPSPSTKSRNSPPCTLDQLPPETISAISTHLDLPSTLSLALTCRSFPPCLERRIFRDVDLVSSALEYRPRGAVPKARIEADKQRKEVQAWCTKVKRRTKLLLDHADRRRWAMVETLAVLPMPETSHLIMSILDSTAPNLRELRIEGDGDRAYRHPHHITFDFKLLGLHLSFPSLTHLHLGEHAIRFNPFIRLLLNWSPNLVYLVVTIEEEVDDPWREELEECFPELERDTLLRQLQISPTYLRSESGQAVALLVDLLRHSPALEIVSFDGSAYKSGEIQLMEALGGLQALHTLHWNISLDAFCGSQKECPPGAGVMFPAVKRLILNYGWSGDIFSNTPSLPVLETIYLAPEIDGLSPTAPCGPAPPPFAQCMKTIFSAALLGSPHLHTLRIFGDRFEYSDEERFSHIETLDFSGDIVGHFSSYRHGRDELLAARVLIDDSDLDQGVKKGEPRGVSELIESTYILPDGSSRVKSYNESNSTIWEDFSDYQGIAVPLEIIEAMRVAEGKSGAEWKGRGVEIGDEAWAVLLEWKDRVGARLIGEGEQECSSPWWPVCRWKRRLNCKDVEIGTWPLPRRDQRRGATNEAAAFDDRQPADMKQVETRMWIRLRQGPHCLSPRPPPVAGD